MTRAKEWAVPVVFTLWIMLLAAQSMSALAGLTQLGGATRAPGAAILGQMTKEAAHALVGQLTKSVDGDEAPAVAQPAEAGPSAGAACRTARAARTQGRVPLRMAAR